MNREFCVADPTAYRVDGLDEVETPRLLFFDWALAANRRALAEACDGLGNVRLMAKTCKASRLLEEYRQAGMAQVKASCASEARVIAENTAFDDVLVAFPPIGPAADAFLSLVRDFPQTRFATVAPNAECARALSAGADGEVRVYLDIDAGMKRTGVPFGRPALDLAEAIGGLPHLRLCGLHAFDGHVRPDNPHAARRHADALMARLDETVRALAPEHGIEEVVSSSSLTFQANFSAHREGGYAWRHTVSPGTVMLWDSNYNDVQPGVFDYAAAIATRILDTREHRGGRLLTTDCGAKMGVSTDIGPPHVADRPGLMFAAGSERFSVWEWLGFDRATGEVLSADACPRVGDAVLVFPRHVCPTVNQYAFGLLVRDGRVAETVPIDARDG